MKIKPAFVKKKPLLVTFPKPWPRTAAQPLEASAPKPYLQFSGFSCSDFVVPGCRVQGSGLGKASSLRSKQHSPEASTFDASRLEAKRTAGELGPITGAFAHGFSGLGFWRFGSLGFRVCRMPIRGEQHASKNCGHVELHYQPCSFITASQWEKGYLNP